MLSTEGEDDAEEVDHDDNDDDDTVRSGASWLRWSISLGPAQGVSSVAEPKNLNSDRIM